jgi:subtilase family serine protease
MRSRRALHSLRTAIAICLSGTLLSCSAFDLVVNAIGVPHSVVPGDPLRVTSRVCNRSDAPSDPADLELVIRPVLPDGSSAGPGEPLGMRWVPALEAGQCHSEETELLAPVGLDNGPYQVVGSIWPLGHSRASEVLGVGWGPDLVVEAVDRPLNALPWSSSALTARVCNRGTDWAPPSRVDLYLSTDAQLVGGAPAEGPADLPAGYVDVPDLAPGLCASVDGTLDTYDPGQGLFLLGAIVDEWDSIAELVEGNNARPMGLMGVGSLPDLVIDSILAPPSANTFSSFEVEAVLCNAGTAPSEPTEVGIYLSADARIRPAPPSNPAGGDPFAGALPVPPLAPGECQSTTGLVDSSVPVEGAWTVGGVVDEGHGVTELMEFNNVLAGPRMGIGYGPDLVVARIDAPHAVENESAFDVSVELCNRGTAFAGTPSSVQLFLSRDAVLEPMPFGMDHEIGIAPAPQLPQGSCAVVTIPAWLDASLDGPARLIALTDAHDEVPELIETNNQSVGNVMGIGHGPDLVVASITTPPSVEPGASFEVEVDVCNNGTGPSMPTAVSLYHSLDEVVSGYPYPGYDLWLGEVMVDLSLMPGTCRSVMGNVTADPIAQGAWYIGAVVDEPDYVVELIEANNGLTGPLMGIGFGPDLVVTHIDGPPSALPDTSLVIDFEVCNQGTSMASASEVSFFLSVDESIEGGPPAGFGDDRWLGSELLPMLEPGRCHAGTGQGWVAPDADGPMRLGAIADEPSAIAELIEVNNAHAGPWLGVGLGPDLVVTRVEGPPTATVSGPILVDLQICNQGTADSPGAQSWIHLSADPRIEESYFAPPGVDPWIGELMTPPMPAGACHDEVVEATAYGVSEGEWYLGAIVDEGRHVDELLESNNVRLGNRIGLGDGPDLVVTSIDVPTSTENGLGFPVSAELCNQGTAPSPTVNLTLYHSEDRTIEGYTGGPVADYQFASLSTGPLLVGECRTLAGTGSTWVPQDGAWFAGAIVDEEAFVDELIESNNHFTGPLMGVGLGPDLVVTSLSGPASVDENAAFSVDVEVCNHGTMSSTMTMVTFYHSEDDTIDSMAGPLPPVDYYLGDFPVPDLPPGACLSTPVELLSGPPGPGYLAAIIDEFNLIPELIDHNNQHLGPHLTVTTTP